MIETQALLVEGRRLPRLIAPLALLLAALVSGSFSTLYSQTPAPAPPQPAPTQTPAAERTGRSYDTGAPAPRRTQAPVPQAPSPVQFTDITTQSRVTFRHVASPTSQKYLMETMGGGVALFDYDNDGRLDLFFTNGAALSDPMPRSALPDKREEKYWNRLYHQKADGTFEDATERAGLQGTGYGMGAAAADFDSDGFTDLYVTAYGGSRLYRNRGNGTFEDVTAAKGVGVPGWATSAGWFDYDRDGRLDLFVARYMDWDFERGALICGSTTVRAYCHPDNFKGAAPLLYHQKADGTFEDVSATAHVNDATGKGLGVAFADFDADGFTDIIVANDSVRQFLFRNNGDGTFEDVALMAGVGYDENGKTFAGMGVDAGDYDNDGLSDIIITALSNETYPLFRNNNDLTFTYTTSTTGVGQITLLYSGWGTRFVDVDNDGWRDIVVAQGHVLDTIEKTTTYLNYRQTPLLMRNTGKGFVNVSASAGQTFTTALAARGMASGDIDNDGDTDIVLAQTDGPPFILRNDGTRNHWLGLALVAASGNRQSIGARVTVTDSSGLKQVYEVTAAGSYLSSSDPRLRIGLGASTALRSVEVRWPSGRTQKLTNLVIDKYQTVTEPLNAKER